MMLGRESVRLPPGSFQPMRPVSADRDVARRCLRLCMCLRSIPQTRPIRRVFHRARTRSGKTEASRKRADAVRHRDAPQQAAPHRVPTIGLHRIRKAIPNHELTDDRVEPVLAAKNQAHGSYAGSSATQPPQSSSTMGILIENEKEPFHDNSRHPPCDQRRL